MDSIVCIKYPYLFKPLQSPAFIWVFQLNAILLLVSLGSATSVDGSGVLWFIALTSLLVSVAAATLFVLKKDELVLASISGGLITWNMAEFVYSTILTVLCAISAWLSFGYKGHVPEGSSSTSYTFVGVLLIFQTVFYAIPVVLIYEKAQFNQTERLSNIHFADEESVPYQNSPAAIF